jgi:hypothetical protein
MELVSGPDVGGGFLFQLTVELGEPFTRYTIHAQEGGIDGGSRPAGSPELVGFSSPATPCAIGGRQCAHREFEVPPDAALRARFAYNRLRFVIGAMVAQRAGRKPAPFEAGLAETLPRIVHALGPAGVPWIVGGSAGARLLGAELDPIDLDLATDRRGVDLIGEALAEFLIEPAGRTRWGEGAVRWGGRAFVGTFQDGICVDWAEATPDPRPAASGEWTSAMLLHPIIVEWKGSPVPVTSPEFGLVRSASAGRPERVTAYLELLRRLGIDRSLLGTALEGSAMDPRTRKRIDESLAQVKERPVGSAGSSRGSGS